VGEVKLKHESKGYELISFLCLTSYSSSLMVRFLQHNHNMSRNPLPLIELVGSAPSWKGIVTRIGYSFGSSSVMAGLPSTIGAGAYPKELLSVARECAHDSSQQSNHEIGWH
jgi:hypothetical protein